MEENFLNWSRDITKSSTFSTQKVTLTEDHLASLLKVKGFQPCLSQIIRHVRPPTERQHVRLNLKHSSLKKQLVDDRKTTGSQKTNSSLGVSVEDARRQVSSETQELKNIVEEEERLIFEERELNRQIALLGVAVKDKEAKTTNLQQWSRTIGSLLPEVAPASSSQQKSMRQEAANEDLKDCLIKLKDLKCRLLGNAKEFQDDKLEVWRAVESLIEKHSPCAVMHALASCTSRETAALNEATQQIDLRSDAKSLRLKYKSSGELVDDLSPRGVLETIESMLVQMSGKHIEKHFANQKVMKEVQATVQSLKNIMDRIRSIAEEIYEDPDLVCEIMTLCDETLKLAGLKATLAAASTLLHDLQLRANAATKANEATFLKHQQIHQFEDKVKSEVTELRSLALGASQVWEELEKQKKEISSTVEEGVGNISLPAPFQKGAFSKEVEAVLDIPFESLKSSVTEGVLSFRGVSPCLPLGPIESSSGRLNGLTSVVPFVTSWDCLLEVARQRKQKVRQCQDFVADEISSFEQMANSMERQSLSTYKVKELCKEVESHDCSSEAKILPVVCQCEESRGDMEQKLDHCRKALNEWWGQPGPVVKEYLKLKESKK